MATDTESRFVLAFDGKSGTINSVLAAVKGQVRAAVADIESTTAKIDAFKGLETSVQALSKSFTSAQDRAAEFRRQIAQIQGSGGEVGKELIRSLKLVEAEITRTSKAYNRQSDQLAAMNASLTAAGVNVSKLAAEELRLADALKTANAAAAQQSAKDLLGFKTLADVTPKIRELTKAFDTLRGSGKLTSTELAAAQQTLRDRIAEVRAQVTGTAEAARAGGPTLASFFSGAILPALGLTAGIGSFISAISSAIGAAQRYQNELAKLGTVTNLSRDQLESYGSAVRSVARTVGVDLAEAQKAFFNLVREGIGEPQALEALRISAEAAKASFSDLNVVAKVGADLMSAYGLKAENLRLVFDQIITAAKNDGPTFEELAPSIGSLAVAAESVGVPFNELISLLNVMASASGDGAGAVAALQKILVQWNTEEVRQKLRDLNIEATDFTGVMRELAERGIPVTQLVDLGIAGARAAVGVATLTRNAGELDEALGRTANASGAAADAIAKLYDSPAARSQRFTAELQDAELNLGKLAGTGSKLSVIYTQFLREFNQIPAAFREAGNVSEEANSSFLDVAKAFLQIDPLAAETARNLKALGFATQEAADKAKAIDAQIKTLGNSFGGMSDALVAGIQELQGGAAKAITEAQTLADTQIAALDRSAGAVAATVAATLAIQTTLANEKLAIITANEAAVTAATEKAVAARMKALQAAGKTEQQIALETTKLRLAALGPVLAQYTDHYNKLVAQAQTYRQRLESIEQSRVSFNEGLEKTLFGIRIAGLSAFDQYVAKVQETEKLIAKAREEGARGNLQAAEKYTQEAIALSGTIEKAVRDDGTVIISEFEAQQKKIELIKKAGEGLNSTYAAQGDAAKTGADATIAQINAVLPRMNELRAAVDDLNRKAAEGVKIKADADLASFAATEARIAELTRDRTVTVTVKEVREGAPAPSGFAAGGTVGEMVRRFAGGGHVFRRPAWMKVPGSGDGDTVPAALNAGSFVVRKSASQYYGDGLMGRLAKGFASGGPVGNESWYDRWFKRSTGRTGNAPLIDDKTGFRTGDSFQSNAPPISFDSRPVPEELITARNVIEYAREMLNMVGESNPLLGSLLPSIKGWITDLERNPNDNDTIKKLLQAAETIGSNTYLFSMWGKTAGSRSPRNPIWFIDWLQKFRAGDLSGAGGGGVASSTSASKFAKKFFSESMLLKSKAMAAGGTTDTVPAMLTPGEWVIKRPAVSKYGAGLLHAINSMQVPRAALQNMLAPPQVRRFAMGGPVSFNTPERSMAAPGGNSITVNLQASAADLLSIDNVRRFIIPVLDGINKRSR